MIEYSKALKNVLAPSKGDSPGAGPCTALGIVLGPLACEVGDVEGF